MTGHVTAVEQHWPYTDKRDYQGTFGADHPLDEIWKLHPERTADHLRFAIMSEVASAMLYLTKWHPEYSDWQRDEAFALADLFTRGYTRAQWQTISDGFVVYRAEQEAGRPGVNPYTLVTEWKLADLGRDELAAILWIVADTFENLC